MDPQSPAMDPSAPAEDSPAPAMFSPPPDKGPPPPAKGPPPPAHVPPPSAMESRPRGSVRGGKARQTTLGLKKLAIPTPSAPRGSPPDTAAVPPPSSAARVGAHGVPISSPSASTTFLPQGAGWEDIFVNFHGNQPQPPQGWMYRPSGFLHMMNQPHYPLQPQVLGENFHLVGQNVPLNPISPSTYGTPSPQAAKQGTNNEVNIVTDDDDNNVVEKVVVRKRYWTHEEEERLASSWLEASKDPIYGNDKKGDTFWKEVTAEFNRKGNGKRTREFNQLKIHWSRLKTSIGDFNDCWSKVTKIHTSGYSDDMLEEEAQHIYANRFGKRFQLLHWWKILKDEPKWCALFEKEKDKTEVIDIPEEQMRPIGREAAKAERSGKRKKTKGMEGVVILGDSVDKIVKINQERQAQLEKVTVAQIEISNVNLKVAKEEKEAKMFEVYNTLLNKDTSTMSEEQKANQDRALHKLEEKLFAD